MDASVAPQGAPHRREPTAEEKRLTFIALMIVFLLSALDQTIVSTAMPTIIRELNGLNLYAWVTTSYLLTSTVMVPIWGKLGDLYGRKLILIIGINIFVLGSGSAASPANSATYPASARRRAFSIWFPRAPRLCARLASPPQLACFCVSAVA